MPLSSPIHHAAAMGRLAQVQAMLAEDPGLLNAEHPGGDNAGGDPSDWKGSTPLVLAARYNQAHIAAVLLRLPGVKLDVRDPRGMGFLHWAAKRHYHAVLALALGQEEEEDEEEEDEEEEEGEGGTPQPMFPGGVVYVPPVEEVAEGSRRLLASKDRVGMTPLMHCTDMSGPVIWEGLEPTLHLILRKSHLPYLEVDTKSGYQGNTALHLILTGRYPRMCALVRLLEFAGADPCIRNSKGLTPLALAREKGEHFKGAVAVLEAAVAETQRTRLLVNARAVLTGPPTPSPASSCSSSISCSSSWGSRVGGSSQRGQQQRCRRRCREGFPYSSFASARPSALRREGERERGERRLLHADADGNAWDEDDDDDDSAEEEEEEVAVGKRASTTTTCSSSSSSSSSGRSSSIGGSVCPIPSSERAQPRSSTSSSLRCRPSRCHPLPSSAAAAAAAAATTVVEGEALPPPPPEEKEDGEAQGKKGEEEEEEEKADDPRRAMQRAVAAFAVGGSIPTEGSDGDQDQQERDCYLPPELFRELMDYVAPPWDALRKQVKKQQQRSTVPSTPARQWAVCATAVGAASMAQREGSGSVVGGGRGVGEVDGKGKGPSSSARRAVRGGGGSKGEE